ncbi:hypothetical protein C8D91_2666 [Marinicella litoralis]|uniref:Uncharacterized protein n=1 Tax=Marinicella litoralis TaxID=644220 RepID=A0A4R6XG33_9GAMM|nr:hypothetical protein C8D91_2666 [Marinicella litoralis]
MLSTSTSSVTLLESHPERSRRILFAQQTSEGSPKAGMVEQETETLPTVGALSATGSEIEGSRLRSKHPKDLPTLERPNSKQKHSQRQITQSKNHSLQQVHKTITPLLGAQARLSEL